MVAFFLKFCDSGRKHVWLGCLLDQLVLYDRRLSIVPRQEFFKAVVQLEMLDQHHVLKV